MADTITEFINVAGLTMTNLSGAGFTVLTNSATETAVVKDVVVSNPKNRRLTFTVSPTDIFEVNESTRLSSSELIGSGTTLKVRSKTTPILNAFSFTEGTLTNLVTTTKLFETAFKDETYTGSKNVTVSQISGTAATTSNASTGGTPAFMCHDVNGNFYYMFKSVGQQSLPSSNKLYRRAGGVAGTETVALNMPFGANYLNLAALAGNGSAQWMRAFQVVYDGKRYIHVLWSDNGEEAVGVVRLSSYDTTTGTTSVITLPDNAQIFFVSAYAITAIDNYVFIFNPYRNAHSEILAYNHVSKQFLGSFISSHDFNGQPSTNSNNRVISGKDSNGNYIVIPLGNTSGTFRAFFLGTNPAVGISDNPRSTITEGLSDKATYDNWVKSSFSDNFIFYSTQLSVTDARTSSTGYTGVIYAFDFDTLKTINLTPSGFLALPFTSSAKLSVLPINTSVLNEDFGLVGIRAAGVKTT